MTATLRSPSARTWILLLLALAAVSFLIRITGPSDLERYAQTRNIGYMLDLTDRGNWIAQRDLDGRILSKPPLHTWLTAPFALAGGVNRLTLVIPSFLAITALTLAVFMIGAHRFGRLAGGLAGMAFVLAPMVPKHMALVRSDAVFALLVTLTAWCAFTAWERGRGWHWFWILGGLATLTKGPLGVLLAAAGLLARSWERRTHPPGVPLRGRQWPGIVVFFSICLAWVIPALWFHGRELVDKIFFDELLGQATGARKDSMPGSNLPRPTLNLLSRFAPFSLLAFYGIWQVFRRPARDAGERRIERFLTCWILAGLVVFSLAAHHRADLLLPLWPPAALLAGREAARLAAKFQPRTAGLATAAIAALLLGFAWWTYHAPTSARAEVVRQSQEIREAAARFSETGIAPADLHHFRSPATFQLHLGTSRISLKREEIPEIRPGYLVTEEDPADILPEEAAAQEVFRHPPDATTTPVVRVFEVTWPDTGGEEP